MKINSEKIVSRWNDVMECVGCEHICIGKYGELEDNKSYYNVEHGITVAWMIEEASYWLSCYSEYGNVRCNDRFNGPEEYKCWRSEKGKLERLVKFLQKQEGGLVVEWSE